MGRFEPDARSIESSLPPPSPLTSVPTLASRSDHRARAAPSPTRAVSEGDVTRQDPDTSTTRPSWSGVGRLYVDGPTGNVAVGDIAKYNSTSVPSARFEVDGSSLLRCSVTFDNSNGESAIVVQGANANALTLKARSISHRFPYDPVRVVNADP